MRYYLYITILLLTFWGCKKDEEIPVSGSIILSSNLVLEGQYISQGFSFKDAKFHAFPGTSPSLVDMVAFASSDSAGVRNIANLICPSNEDSAFFLAGSFTTLDEAKTFYTNLTSVSGTYYIGVTPPLHPYDVWLVHTGRGNFAKIIIKEIKMKEGTGGTYLDLYLDWQYQPNGSRFF